MRLSEAADLVDREMVFPVSHDALVRAVGDNAIEAPTGESALLVDVLDRSERKWYHSVEDVHDTISGNLDEAHVGRKHYDDRGVNHHAFDPVSL